MKRFIYGKKHVCKCSNHALRLKSVPCTRSRIFGMLKGERGGGSGAGQERRGRRGEETCILFCGN